MVFNTVFYGGGKIKNTDALLAVYVLTGSTVFITKNGTSITPTIWTENASNTIDCALFVIPSSTFDNNSWSISASVSGRSASSTIVIDSAKEYEVNLVQELSRLHLLKGNPIDVCTGVTGGWYGSAIVCGTASYPQTRNGMTPTINTSGTYFVVSCGQTWQGNNFYDGCIRTTNLTSDLSGYSTIVMNYNISLSGQTGAYYGSTVRPFASKTKISSNQTQATNASARNHQSNASNQTLSVSISGGGYVEVGVGINQYYNPGTAATVTITSMYAE